MPVCPRCRAEYRVGFDHCGSCDVALVEADELPPQMSEEELLAAMDDSELVPVMANRYEIVKEFHKSLLHHGVPALLRQEDSVGTEQGHFLVVEVVVRKDDVERASAVYHKEFVEQLERDGLVEVSFGFPADGDGAAEGDDLEGSEGEGGEGDESEAEDPACPACGSTEALVEGECPDCGLFLGDDG